MIEYEAVLACRMHRRGGTFMAMGVVEYNGCTGGGEQEAETRGRAFFKVLAPFFFFPQFASLKSINKEKTRRWIFQ